MAQIIKKDPPSVPPRKKAPVLLILAAISVIAAIVGIVSENTTLMVVGIIGAVVCFIFGVSGSFALFNPQAQIQQAGEMGEAATAHLIAQLPAGYFGFQNIRVTYQGNTSELDMVVVGRTGVFIIETKNHNGNIQGNFDQHQWIQYKTGRQGGQYSKEFYNPVKQVGTHTYRLAHYLRDRGCNVHVDSMVFFTNPTASIQVYGTPGRIPVYAGQQGAELIFRQILSGNANLTPNQIHQICNLLNAVC